MQNKAIAKQLGVTETVVAKWRKRFLRYGLEGLGDASRRGRPKTFAGDDKLLTIKVACQRPSSESHWSVRTLQKHLQQEHGLKISSTSLQRVLALLDLKPHQCESWLESRDPEFEAKQTQLVGLYLSPPENALVLSVDEETGIQALGRPKLPEPLRPRGSRKRSTLTISATSTQSLLAALLVYEGKVFGKCYDRHTHEQFLDL